MYSALKISCLAIYLLAIAGFTFAMPAALAFPIQLAAGAMLLAHALEAVIFMRHVRLYKGSLAASLLLTLLFGLLHWKPLADASKAAN
jgi:hypothetical protein